MREGWKEGWYGCFLYFCALYYIYYFKMRTRYARREDVPAIMNIINQAKVRLANLGIDQWQSGYPNEESLLNDISNKNGYVVVDKNEVVAYAAIIFDGEPTYTHIDGQRLTDQSYVVVHRIAVADDMLRRGVGAYVMQTAERKALRRGVHSFRIDTHFGNRVMRNLIRKHGFTLCGIVQVRDGQRMAYEKVLN